MLKRAMFDLCDHIGDIKKDLVEAMLVAEELSKESSADRGSEVLKRDEWFVLEMG